MGENNATRRAIVCHICGLSFTTWRAFTGHGVQSHAASNAAEVVEDMIEGVPVKLSVEEARYVIEHPHEFTARTFAEAKNTLQEVPA